MLGLFWRIDARGDWQSCSPFQQPLGGLDGLRLNPWLWVGGFTFPQPLGMGHLQITKPMTGPCAAPGAWNALLLAPPQWANAVAAARRFSRARPKAGEWCRNEAASGTHGATGATYETDLTHLAKEVRTERQQIWRNLK